MSKGGKGMKDYSSFISFEDVSFRYPDKDRFAIRHLSANIKEGEFISSLGIFSI